MFQSEQRFNSSFSQGGGFALAKTEDLFLYKVSFFAIPSEAVNLLPSLSFIVIFSPSPISERGVRLGTIIKRKYYEKKSDPEVGNRRVATR